MPRPFFAHSYRQPVSTNSLPVVISPQNVRTELTKPSNFQGSPKFPNQFRCVALSRMRVLISPNHVSNFPLTPWLTPHPEFGIYVVEEAPPNLNGKEFKKNTKPRRSTLPGEFLATATRPKYKLTYFLDDLSIQFKQAIQAPSKTRSDKVQLTSRGQLESKPPACQHAIRVPVVVSLTDHTSKAHLLLMAVVLDSFHRSQFILNKNQCSLSTNMPSVHDEHARVSDFGSMWVLVLHLFSFSSENGIRRQIRVHGILKALLACESRTLDLDLRDYVLVDANAQI